MLNLIPSFCLHFCKETNSMITFVHKPLKKGISKPFGYFVTTSQSMT